MPKQSSQRIRSSASVARNSPETTGGRRVCRTCSGCQRTPCQLCVYCRSAKIAAHTRTCLFRSCLHYTYSERTMHNVKLAAERSYRSLRHVRSDAQRFLQQCQSILIQSPGISIDWQTWQQDALLRVWLYQREQWGIAQRVSEDPPRYNIQLLASSSTTTTTYNSNGSEAPPRPRWNRSKNASYQTKKKKKRKDNTTMLTNIAPYEFDLECHLDYLEQMKKKPQLSSTLKSITPRNGQPFVHAWRRSSGDVVQVKGTWTGELRENSQQQYEIKVDHVTLLHPKTNHLMITQQQHQQQRSETTIDFMPSTCWVSGDDLHAGYFRALSLETTPPINNTPRKLPFFVRYHTPALRISVMSQQGQLPRASFVWDDRFRIELQVFPSRQAEDAGYGLFAFVQTIHDSDNADPTPANLELPPGTMIDLGVYGPLRSHDRKTWPVRLVKSFIYKYHCGSWFFETNKDDHSVFDMTDDTTGELHELVQRNVLVYVNETSGSIQDIPSLWPHYDPEGAIHFYLGHPDHHQGPLVLPLGTPVELLVDYGPQYEQERVRKKYPRVWGEHLQHLQECLREENYSTIQELEELSMKDIESEVIPFLKSLVESWDVLIRENPQKRNSQHLERALMVTMIILHEQREMALPSESNLATLRVIISTLCSLFVNDQQLQTWITSNVVYQKAIRRILGNHDWNIVRPTLFRRAIIAL